MKWWNGSVVGVAMLLSACATHSVRPTLPAVTTANAEVLQSTRAATLATHQQWSLQGRVALSNGRNGGSGRIDWHQDGMHYDVTLSAPITRQGWRLSGDPEMARVDGLTGGPRVGADAETLLRDATGWVIPVAALASWVRGAATVTVPTPTLEFAPDGHLSQLQQAGWTIDYSDWRMQSALGIELPHRLNASQGNAKVRLVIDQWQEGAPAP
ncbi:MAG: lipoprotein insertase outer membrane protein LolB [Luteimonas sp.]